MDIERAADGQMRLLTIIQCHSCRLIDEHADYRSGPLAGTFDIDEVESEGSDNRSGNCTHRFRYLLGPPHREVLRTSTSTAQTKKWATAHFNRDKLSRPEQRCKRALGGSILKERREALRHGAWGSVADEAAIDAYQRQHFYGRSRQ